MKVNPYFNAYEGGTGPPPFDPDAVDYLAMFSAGVPRVLNLLCDNALELASTESAGEVLPEHVVMAAKALAGRGSAETAGSERLLFRVYEGGVRKPG